MFKNINKKLLIFFIIFCSLSFFKFSFLDLYLVKQIQIFGLLLTLIVILISIINKSNVFKQVRQNFKLPIIFIFVSVFLSMFAAHYVHNQPLFLTFISQRFMYFYLFYFMLHSLRIKANELEKIIIIVAILYSILYILQFTFYDVKIFEVTIGGRTWGINRIYIPGLEFIYLAFFLYLLRYFNNRKIVDLTFSLLFISIIILRETRMVLLSISLVILFIIFRFQKKRRLTTILLVFAMGISTYYLFSDILNTIYKLTIIQLQSLDNYIRFKEISFFLTEFSPNIISYIFGNGIPNPASSYYQDIIFYKTQYGLYQSDIGIIGAYTKFGVLFLIGVFGIIWRVFKVKKTLHNIYIKYLFLFIIISILTSSSFSRESSIVVISCALYLIDLSVINKGNQQLNP